RGTDVGRSQPLLEGLGVYADHVLLLADRENEIAKAIEHQVNTGVIEDSHAVLWDSNLEEENFTPQELLDMARRLAAEQGAELTLDVDTLREADRVEKETQRPPRGMSEMLCRLARNPDHGAVRIDKAD